MVGYLNLFSFPLSRYSTFSSFSRCAKTISNVLRNIISSKQWEFLLEKSCNLTRIKKTYVGNCYGNVSNPKANCFHQTTNFTDEYHDACLQKCGNPKKSYMYDLSLSHIIDPEEFCFENGSYIYLTGVRIKLTTIKEIAKMSALDLFGLIGGYLGLFVGVSLTTILEFLEFGAKCLYSQLCAPKAKIGKMRRDNDAPEVAQKSYH